MSRKTTPFLTQLSRPENSMRFLRIAAKLADCSNLLNPRPENRTISDSPGFSDYETQVLSSYARNVFGQLAENGPS